MTKIIDHEQYSASQLMLVDLIYDEYTNKEGQLIYTFLWKAWGAEQTLICPWPGVILP